MGAMVASVASRGYVATRLSDLVEISGVSSKSFYTHFPDKEACFLATVEALIDHFSQERDTIGFAGVIAAQPAAARVCLIEAYAAGPAVRERLHDLIEELEIEAQRVLPASSSKLPAEAASAYVGAVLELARHRLLNGTVSELPAAVAGLAERLLPAYRSPREPLRPTTRRSPPVTETDKAPDHAQRIMRALARVAAEDGYANTTIDRIVTEAGISASIFYDHFGSKEEAALAAIDGAAAELLAVVLPTFRRESVWTVGVHAALGSFFSFLTSRPAAARLLFFESYAVGPAGLVRREEALRPLEVLWAPARRRDPEIHPAAVEAILGGIFHLIFRRVEGAGSPALQNLTPLATYLALAPFVGAEEAGEVASGQRRGREHANFDPEAVRATAAQPLRLAILNLLTRGELSAEEVASRLDQPGTTIRHHLAEMERAALVAPTRTGANGPGRYRTQMGEIHTEEWARLTPPERALVTAQVLGLSEADIERARRSGTLDARVERVLVRLPQLVDEQGWQELSELHAQMLTAATEIGARSKARLEESGDQGISVRTLWMLFEVPSGEDSQE